ncbi:hypothetical protein C8Q79DRAFT_941915 [Trametes meyenii]|nr:hypothetical protein C8Q79DRAFT_941915 [Trametes meyenii]
MSLSDKRSASPLPLYFDNIKKVRLSEKKKKDQHGTVPASAVANSLPRLGQEVVTLSPFLPQTSTHQNVNDIILKTTARLAQEGKRLTRAPQLLPDGIAFDWIFDLTAQGDSLKALLSVQGIRSTDLDRVLSRINSHPSRASTFEPPNAKPQHEVDTSSNVSVFPVSPVSFGNASNPIIIDDDEDGPGIIAAASHTLGTVAPNPSQIADAAADDYAVSDKLTDASPSSPAAPRSQSSVTASNEYNVGGPSRLPCYDRRSFPRSRTPKVQRVVGPEKNLPFIDADDRASVVTYASPPRPERVSGTGRDLTHDQEGGPSPSKQLRRENYVSEASDPPGSIRNSVSPSRRQLEKRRADYGNWKSLAAESSQAEMSDERLSSRESSPERAFPPQALAAVPGLNFLPQTHDVFGLAAPQVYASGSRTGSRSDSNPSSSEHGRPPPHHAHRQRSHIRSHRTARDSKNSLNTEASSGDEDSDGPRHRRVIQGAPARSIGRSSDSSGDSEDEHMDIDAEDAEVQQEMNLLSTRSLRRKQCRTLSGAHTSTSRGRSNASTGHVQFVRPARRARSSSAGSDDDPEKGQCDLAAQMSPDGHTVVIPKAEFARARRLLAPKDQHLPLTTILMRGDAHFIDQRRKARRTAWSLPVEDDSRHVEDACLIGDNTVVVGYNKGPYQVSLIPVCGDQPPRRIDLTYKAHSTVIENRTAGISQPNPGIASIAPLVGDRFLSGGHDKTVRLWTVTRNDDRGAPFSAHSVRIPTQHVQAVQALACSSRNSVIYSAAGDWIATTNLDARAPTEPVRVSGKITQVHVHPQYPHFVILEIDHMDRQVHLYDVRMGGFARKPQLEFGHRAAPPRPRSASSRHGGGNANARGGGNGTRNGGRSGSTTASASTSTKISASAPKLGSRYIRGSAANSLFARGYADGAVLVWDYRDGARKEVLRRFRAQRPDGADVVHTVLAGSDVIAYGGYSVTFWSMLSD